MTESLTTHGVILRSASRAGQRVRRIFPRAVLASLAAIVAIPTSIRDAVAHEIPSSVSLRIFVKRDSTRIRVLARAPLEAMRDIDFPLRAGTPFLDRHRSDSLLPQAAQTWILNSLHVEENGSELAGTVRRARLSLPIDGAFGAYGTALRHFDAPPLDARLDLTSQGTMLDVEIEYAVRSPASAFTIRPELARLGVRTTSVLTFVGPDGTARVIEYAGDPGPLRLNPRWYHAALQFGRLGVGHIWSGVDHLLFIICLVLPFRKLRPLIGIITAFTVAHSITLIASTLGWAPGALWFPPLVEVMIALSIAWMALENIVEASRDRVAKVQRRWIMAFAFGLVHGFGFAFGLRESLQLAGPHLALALVSFNAGVELGQVAVLLLALPVLALAYRHVVSERAGIIIVSAFVTHTAWHWLGDRWSAFRAYSIDWASATLPLIRLCLAMAIGIGLAMIVSRLIRLRASRIQGDAV